MNPSYWFIMQHDNLIIGQDTSSPLVTDTMLNGIEAALYRQHCLGRWENRDIYCAELMQNQILPQHLTAIPLRKALDVLGPQWYDFVVKAATINNWDKTHQFCGLCGNKTEQKANHFERICTLCQHIFYPRISPTVIGLIYRNDHIIMARSPHFSAGAYALIAGFIEAGENAEAALHREVKEEIGVTIKNLQYFGSQVWPFPDSLMLGFIAEHANGEIVIDGQEIEAAGWYHYQHLPGRPSSKISLASKMIDYFIAKQTTKT